MGRILILTLVVVLLAGNVGGITGSDATVLKYKPIRVLVDETKKFVYDRDFQNYLIEDLGWSEYTDWGHSFENYDDFWGFGNVNKGISRIASVDIKKSGRLSYSTLKNYDVLVVASFVKSYSSSEVEEIKEFVENGGGLLVLGDSDYPCNSISREFDVGFSSETVAIADQNARKEEIVELEIKKLKVQGMPTRDIVFPIPRMYYFFVEDISDHQITEGIKKITLYFGNPIITCKSGKALIRTSADTWADKIGEGVEGVGEKDADENQGPFDLLVALKIGKGRAVFVGSAYSFWNLFTSRNKQNADLLVNAIVWLGEPGGPYKQYKLIVEQAQQVMSEAKSLYDSHNFPEAKGKFEEAIGIFETSGEIFPNTEATQGIEEAKAYIEKCEIGMEADRIFENATDLYNKREYERAIEEYEKAKTLCEQIEYTTRAGECTTKVDESKKWIALREEATSLFQQGEQALTTAPSTFDPSGYENAMSLFEQAKAKWEEYKDPAQVAACEEKIKLCTDEIAKISKNRMVAIVGSVIIVVIVLVVIVLILIRRRKPKPAVEAPPVMGPGTDALGTLEERYARGEITKEEYEKLKSVLEK